MREQAEAGPPFFIVGSARSGTTLMRSMLNAHSELAVPPESRFITELWDGAGTVAVEPFLERLEQHVRFEAWELPIDAVRAELADAESLPYPEAVAAAYRAYARTQGKQRWGDKTPRYVESIEFIAGLWPDAKFVHLVRDGRNVALSYADVPFGPKTVARAASLWARRVEKGITAGRKLGAARYIELSYERLTEDPEGQMRGLCDFLEVSYERSMIDSDRAEFVLRRSVKYNPLVAQAPTAGVRDWSEQMPAGQVEVFEAVAGDVLGRLGYERRHPSPGLRARVLGAVGRMGAPTGRLRATRGRPEN